GLHRLVQRTLHGPAEAGPLLQLFGDVLRDQLGIDLGPVDLHGLDLDVPVAQVFQVLGQLVDLLPLLADDHADAGGIDVDHDLLARQLDLDAGDAGPAVLPLDEAAELEILDQQLAEVLLVGIPLAEPVGHDADAKARGSNLLPHRLLPFLNDRRSPRTQSP